MPAVSPITTWRPRTPFYYGWLVLGTAALGAFAATGVAQVVLGGIQNLIFEDMGWDRSTIAFAVTAGTWASGLLTPLVGRLADRYGPRGLMPGAALVVGACYFALAGIQSVWHFYAAYIVARAIANPNLIGVVPRTLAVNFFERKRNFALGLTSMARPVGGAINVQLISFVAQAYSWRAAYRGLGVFTLVLAVPLFLIMRRRPEDIGLRPDGRPPSSRPPLAAASASEPRRLDWRVGEVARTPTFWFVVAAESVTILTEGAMAFQVVLYLRDSEVSQPVAAAALSLATLFGALVSPGWGFLSDRFAPRRLAMVALSTSAVVTSLFLAADPATLGFFLVVLWGAASGGLNALGSMMIADYFGRRSFGSIIGLMGPFQLGFLGLGPTFGAILYSLTGDYTALFVYAVAGYCVAFLFVYKARAPRPPSRAGASPARG